MQVKVEGDELVLLPGGLRGESRIPLAGIDEWDLFYEILGRRFLAFHTGDRTHHVNLPRLAPTERTALLNELTRLLGRAPSVELLALERDNEHWLKAWEVVKTIGRYLRLFINPRAPLR